LKARGRRRIPLGTVAAINGAAGGQPVRSQEESATLTASQLAGEGASRSPKTQPTMLCRHGGDWERAGSNGGAPPTPDPELATRCAPGGARPRNAGVKLGGREAGGGGSWEGGAGGPRPPTRGAGVDRSPRGRESREERGVTVIFLLYYTTRDLDILKSKEFPKFCEQIADTQMTYFLKLVHTGDFVDQVHNIIFL
jgi:hypothetical protein